MWGRGQSACRFVLCFRKNGGERYAAASVKPCKNRPTDSVPAPQKSLHSVNLPQTEASLSLSDYVLLSTQQTPFLPSIAHAKLAADGTPVKSFKHSFSRPPFTSAGGVLRGLGQCRLVEFQNADDCRSPPPFCRRYR